MWDFQQSAQETLKPHPAERDPVVAAALTPPWALEPGCDPQDAILNVALRPPSRSHQLPKQAQHPRGQADVAFNPQAASATPCQHAPRNTLKNVPGNARGAVKSSSPHITTTASPRAARQQHPSSQHHQHPFVANTHQAQHAQRRQQQQQLPRRPLSPNSRPAWQGLGDAVPKPSDVEAEPKRQQHSKAGGPAPGGPHSTTGKASSVRAYSSQRLESGRAETEADTYSVPSKATNRSAKAAQIEPAKGSEASAGGSSSIIDAFCGTDSIQVGGQGAWSSNASSTNCCEWDVDPNFGWGGDDDTDARAHLSNAAAIRLTHAPCSAASDFSRSPSLRHPQPSPAPSSPAVLAQQPPLELGASDWSLGSGRAVPSPAAPKSRRSRPSNSNEPVTPGAPAGRVSGATYSTNVSSIGLGEPEEYIGSTAARIRPPLPSVAKPPPAYPVAKKALLPQHQHQQQYQAHPATLCPASPASLSQQQQPQFESSTDGPGAEHASSARARRPSTSSSTDHYHLHQGPGLSVMSGRAGSAGGADSGTAFRSALEAEEEAAALRAEVVMLKEALGVWQMAGDQASALPPQQESTVLQRYRAQIWQQQRQVALMGAELKARAKVVAEADAMLQEVSGQLGGLVEATEAAGGDAQVATVLTAEHALSLGRWALKMQQRLRSERARSSKSMTRRGLQQQHAEDAGAAAARESGAPAAGHAPRWEVPFIPAGGNRFLAAATTAAAEHASCKRNKPSINSKAVPRDLPGVAAAAAAAAATGVRASGSKVDPTSASASRVNMSTSSSTRPGPKDSSAPSAHTPSSLAGAAMGAAIGGAKLTIARLAAGLVSLGGSWSWGTPATGSVPTGSTNAAGMRARSASPPSNLRQDPAPFAPSAHANNTSTTANNITNNNNNNMIAGLLSQLGGGSGLVLAALLTQPEQCAGLEGRLCGLAPKLGSVAVLLRTLVLPAMPWLSIDGAERIQVEVAECCSATAAAASALWELSCLIPSGAAAAVSGSQGFSDLSQQGAEVSAGRDSWLWANVEASAKEAKPVGSGGPADTCGVDVEGLLAAALPLLEGVSNAAAGSKPKKQHQLWGTGPGRAGPAAAFQQLQEAVGIPLRACLQATAAKQSLLESELHFCCRICALQGEHVKRLIATTEAELQQVRQRRLTDAAEVRASAGSPRTTFPPKHASSPVAAANPKASHTRNGASASSPPCPSPPVSSPPHASVVHASPTHVPASCAPVSQAAFEAASALKELLHAQDVLERCPGELELATLAALFQSNRAALEPAPHILLQQHWPQQQPNQLQSGSVAQPQSPCTGNHGTAQAGIDPSHTESRSAAASAVELDYLGTNIPQQGSQVGLNLGAAYDHAMHVLASNKQHARQQHHSQDSQAGRALDPVHMPWDAEFGNEWAARNLGQQQLHGELQGEASRWRSRNGKQRGDGGGGKNGRGAAIEQPAWES